MRQGDTRRMRIASRLAVGFIAAAVLSAPAVMDRGPAGRACAAPADPFTARGIVLDDETGRPVPGADVLLWARSRALLPEDSRGTDADWPAEPIARARTDERGAFEVRGTTDGGLRWVSVAARGYAATARACDSAAAGELRIARAAVRRIRLVVARDGPPEPAKGAVAIVLDSPGLPAARLQADGGGWVSAPVREDADLLVGGTGWAWQFARVGAETVELSPGGPVTGVVSDAAGKPVRDADVVLDCPGIDLVTRTDAAGRFEIRGGAVDSRWPNDPGLDLRASGTAGSAVARVCAGDTQVRLVLAKGRRVEGRVLDEGKPVRGATVRDTGEGSGSDAAAFPEATTDASGAFMLDGVPCGVRRVQVGLRGETRSETTVVREIPPGDGPFPVEIEVPAFRRRVSFHFVDGARAPIPGVRIGDILDGGVELGQTGPDGRLTATLRAHAGMFSAGILGGIPPGYGISLTRIVPASELDVIVPNWEPVRLVAVDPGGARVPAENLDGHARAADGAPDFLGSGEAPPPGSVWLPRGLPAHLTVKTTRPVPLVYDGLVRPEDVRDHQLQVRLRAAPPPTTVRGSFRLPSGRSPGSERVEVWRDDGAGWPVEPRHAGLTAAGGVLRGTLPGSGRYVLVVMRNRIRGVDALAARTFEAREGAETDLGAILEPTSADIAGTARIGGRPAPGVTVSAHAWHGPVASSTTDMEGRFSLRVPAGPGFQVAATRPGYGTVSVKVAAEAGRSASVVLDLPEEARVILRNAAPPWRSPVRATLRNAGVFREVSERRSDADWVVERLAPGQVEIRLVDEAGVRMVSGEAVAGRIVELVVPD